jgi:hypothetical protein
LLALANEVIERFGVGRLSTWSSLSSEVPVGEPIGDALRR